MSNASNPGERGGFSAPPKAGTVLRGESLELLSRELGATLSGWRDDFLVGGRASLERRPADNRDEEIARLRAEVGEPTLDNELLTQRFRGDHPLCRSGTKGELDRSIGRRTAYQAHTRHPLARAGARPVCRVWAEYVSSMAAYVARLDAPFNCQ
jgi:hypothetical protein